MSGRVSAADVAAAVLAARAGGPSVAVAMLVEATAGVPCEPGRRLLVRETGEAVGTLGSAELDDAAHDLAREALAGERCAGAVPVLGGRCTIYVEAHAPPEDLLIVGAGHIAVPLAQLGVLLGFHVTVLDDREAFATPERFPPEASVRRADFADPFRDVPLSRRSYVVLVTRGHRYDFDCLSRVLEGDVEPRYIGMIGSRRRVRAAFRALIEAGGLPRERLALVHAPVGLDIGAETPEEIAVSIAAEIVSVRRRPAVPRAAVHTGESATSPALGPAPDRVHEPAAAPAPANGLSGKERVLDRLLPGPAR